jgi:RNA polymerase sigma-70 factor (ECF subfamily)
MKKTETTQGLHNREQADLLALARAGSAEAFERIMRQNNRSLYRIARSILNDASEAEDVVQETYLRAFTHLQDIQNPYALKSWLTRTAANEALGRLRRHKPAESLDSVLDQGSGFDANIVSFPQASNAENPELTAIRRETLNLVEIAIENMPMIYRSVFMLRAIEGLTTEDTAVCLGISKETVKTRFHRAKTALNEEMKQMAMGVLNDVFSFDGTRCDRIVGATLERLTLMAVIRPI